MGITDCTKASFDLILCRRGCIFCHSVSKLFIISGKWHPAASSTTTSHQVRIKKTNESDLRISVWEAGHIIPKNRDDQFLFVTLNKQGRNLEQQYHD